MCRIILEGPDGVGKTTLGMRLADELKLGFFRKRCMHGIAQETSRALTLTDCVLDRSWMTDVIYSRFYDRTPGCSRSDIYSFGLMAARWCCLYIKMELTDGVSASSSPIPDVYGIGEEYKKPHWSEPYHAILKIPAKPGSSEFGSILRGYASRTSIVDCCPSSGIGSANPCDVLCTLPPSDVVKDLMFCCGIRPDQIHFADSMWESNLQPLMDWFKPKIVLTTPGMKMALESRTFDSARAWLSEQLIKAGIPYSPLEPGWRVLKDGPE